MIRLFHYVIPCLWLFLASMSVCHAMELSPDEQSYLDKLGKVTVCVDPDWYPFEKITDKGKHDGIAADLLQLLAQRTGIQFELVQTSSWKESIEASQTDRCMVISFLNETPQRKKWLDFSDPLFSDPYVFITREEHSYISDPAYLLNEKIVLPHDVAIEEVIRKKYPNLTIVIVNTELEALRMVAEKKADMTAGMMITTAYTIKKEGLFSLKIAGQFPNYANNLRVGIVKSEPMLRQIMNKGISTITPEEKWQIVNKHISINAQTALDYNLLRKIMIGFGLLFFIGFYWNYKLKKLNRELIRVSQTDPLTDLPNRIKLDQELAFNLLCAKQIKQPFSILIFDIDNFKKVNDELGHQIGDKVLQEMGQIAKQIIRSNDTVGRWGGEEFLVLCPETTSQQAKLLAEQLRQAIQGNDFASQREQTVSVGVATLRKDDTIDSLIRRADQALYEAKHQGKNQVCFL